MLLPALAAAREKARRSSCLSNLNQMAKAMESYCGDYSQYFPCNATGGKRIALEGETSLQFYYRTYKWISDTRLAWEDFGVVTDSRITDGEDTVLTNAIGSYTAAGSYSPRTAPYFFRNVFLGSRTNTTTGTGKAGDLNMAPVGLGYLLSAGYIGDGRLYFCPSSTGMVNRSLDWMRLWEETNGTSWEAADNVRDLQRVGGFDAETVMTGDWSWLGRAQNYMRFSPARVMFSHYVYRGLPTNVYGGNGSVTPYPDPVGQSFRIHGVKPDRMVWPGEPVFKTQKQLAGRALVSDAWCRSAYNELPAIGTGIEPGEGFYAHKEGYNVLYGDWHAKWSGDPQGQLLWWPMHTFTGVAAGDYVYYSILNTACNTLTDAEIIHSGATHNLVAKGAHHIWHLFDVNEGIDVGVDEEITTF